MPNYLIGLLLVGFVATCVLLVLAILVQKPQGGGLAGAFGGGAGSGQTAFGTKTGDALTWMTIIIFILYLGTAIGMNYAARPTVAPTENTEQTGTKKGPPPESTTTTPSTTPSTTPATNPTPAPSTTPAPAPVNTPTPITPALTPSTTPAPSTTPSSTPPATTPPATPPTKPGSGR